MTEQPLTKKSVDVLDSRIAYHERGEGAPLLLLHGNPTSSYLWRDVIPGLAGRGRLVAPDLIGMGDSGKLPNAGPDTYRFTTHRRYLDAFIDAVIGRSDSIVLVVHDWGSALGFDWANRHRDAVAGLVYMEAIVRPVTWTEWPEAARRVFQGFRSEAGEQMILERNVFVENVLPGSVLRQLTEEEMAEYRRPFLEPGEGRRPTLTWPRQIPIDGEPADVTEIVTSYGEWLRASPVPKLFVDADPGAILRGDQREFCRTWPNQREVTVRGSHFVQEDSPDEIGRAIAEWLPTTRR